MVIHIYSLSEDSSYIHDTVHFYVCIQIKVYLIKNCISLYSKIFHTWRLKRTWPLLNYVLQSNTKFFNSRLEKFSIHTKLERITQGTPIHPLAVLAFCPSWFIYPHFLTPTPLHTYFFSWNILKQILPYYLTCKNFSTRMFKVFCINYFKI